jgi:hypothetical protein
VHRRANKRKGATSTNSTAASVVIGMRRQQIKKNAHMVRVLSSSDNSKRLDKNFSCKKIMGPINQKKSGTTIGLVKTKTQMATGIAMHSLLARTGHWFGLLES